MVRMNFIFILSSDPNLLQKKSVKQKIKKTLALDKVLKFQVQELERAVNIRITCPCDIYIPPYTPLLFSKTGVYRGIHF